MNVRDREGWTALHCACAEGHVDIVRVLGNVRGVDEMGGVNGGDGQGGGEVYRVQDGPVDLQPFNDDGELPEDVVLEERRGEILEVLEGEFLLFGSEKNTFLLYLFELCVVRTNSQIDQRLIIFSLLQI